MDEHSEKHTDKYENHNDGQNQNHDPHFEPTICLPEVEWKTLEENEHELLKLFDVSEIPPEWKERGVGDIKILKHTENNVIRILMRREKTLKICANHLILPNMQLTPHNSSDKVYIWNTPADFSDEISKPELLAVRFATVENAQKFKEVFEICTQKQNLEVTSLSTKMTPKITNEESVKNESKNSNQEADIYDLKSDVDISQQLIDLKIINTETQKTEIVLDDK